MFIISWHKNDRISETCVAEREAVSSLAGILEDAKIVFCVSSSTGKLLPKHFGFGGYRYWKEDFLI